MSHLSEERLLFYPRKSVLKQTILSLRNELDECSGKDAEIGTAISNFEKEKRNYRGNNRETTEENMKDYKLV